MSTLPYSLEDAVKNRYSMRTFSDKPVDEATRKNILDYAEKIDNPFGPKLRLKFIEKSTDSNGEKLGTYGIIKNAKLFLGVAVKKTGDFCEAIGYEFEKLVLYMTSLGLGTCWIGGTFDKGSFAQIMQPAEDEIFTIISPVGYGTGKKRMFEKVMRANIKADTRLPWDKLFFKDDFKTALVAEKQDSSFAPFAKALEFVRLAPSAVNKQPWRIVYDGKTFHFFENHSLPASSQDGYDIQRVDMGIAECHFDLALKEEGIEGHFEKMDINFEVPAGTDYITSWVGTKS